MDIALLLISWLILGGLVLVMAVKDAVQDRDGIKKKEKEKQDITKLQELQDKWHDTPMEVR